MRISSLMAFGIVLVACAGRDPVPASPPRARTAGENSVICEALLGHFLGLPAQGGSTREDAPAAGRWWVRRCDFGRSEGELFVRLAGPAWVWVDRNEPPFHLRDNVYFSVDAELRGQIGTHIGVRDGVVSLWFRATRADVKVEPLGRVHPSSANFFVSMLRRLAAPVAAWNVDARARAELDSEVTGRFRSALSRGFTMVYDISREQADFGLGLLPEGVVPRHPFTDGRPWLSNERVIAAPGAVHVLGPFPPEGPLSLEARITSGTGLSWRAVCSSNVEHEFASVERGEPGRIPSIEVLSAGTLSGSGVRNAKIAVPDCPFYVILSPLGQAISNAAIRLRQS